MSVDLKTLQDLTIHTRRQSSRVSPLETFGLDITQDILRGVTGEPRDLTLAKRLTGADALAITSPTQLGELSALGSRLLRLSKGNDYKDRFGWIDQMRAVTDRSLIDTLNAALVTAVNNRDADAVQLGPPEPLPWERVEFFKYSTSDDSAEYNDLDSRDFMAELGDEVTLAALRAYRVEMFKPDVDHVSHEWSLYKCLLF